MKHSEINTGVNTFSSAKAVIKEIIKAAFSPQIFMGAILTAFLWSLAYISWHCLIDGHLLAIVFAFTSLVTFVGAIVSYIRDCK